MPTAADATQQVAKKATRRQAKPPAFPSLSFDPQDPAMYEPTPTTMSVPTSVMRRFEASLPASATYMTVVLDAMRAHGHHVPQLVLERRNLPSAGDMFPWRAAPRRHNKADRPTPLRVRPVKGELDVIDAVAEWATAVIRLQRPRLSRVTRSEVVTVVLDEYLPSPAEDTAQQ